MLIFLALRNEIIGLGVNTFLKSGSHLPKRIVLFASFESPFKNDEKCFLFHLKSSFHSLDI